ncbi:aminoacyl-tRNA hydrolase [Ihubacter sp. rT4E-8]|uniref:aminoacyl-tRNA hydrolase n=1 Tax=Ihubacter sp. rT4E-8 TaxID=3242369 RepID=UPI003CF206FD
MYVIAGLGNPGKKYAHTRHNIGFITIDQLAEKHNIKVDKLKFKALVGEGRIADQKVLLVKPQTYMNLSGESLREVMHFYKLPPEQLIVIYDDIDLEAGALRIRKFGSAGTHNGMRSVVYQIQSDRFPRIRIGIGKSEKKDLVDFVIGGFTKEEVPALEEAVTKAACAVECILEDGIDRAMNQYNTKKKSLKDEKKDEKREDAE